MRPSSLKLTSPLKLSVVIAGAALLVLALSVLFTLHFSLQENEILAKSVSNLVILSEQDKIRVGEYRDLFELLNSDFPELSLKITHGGKTLFRFHDPTLWSSCYAQQLALTHDEEALHLEVCKPLAYNFEVFLPLILCFLIISLLLTSFALKMEKDSIHSLRNFLKEAGISLSTQTSFGETLQQLHKLQSEFIAMRSKMAHVAEQKSRIKISTYLAHDLRSPLLAFEEAISLRSYEEWNLHKPRMQNAIQRIHKLVNSLHEQRVATINRQYINSLDFSSLCEEMSSLASQRGLNFHYSKNEIIGSYFLDFEKIERAVSNLLHNALAFAKSSVELQIDSDNYGVFIRVSDDGAGIPEEFRDLIYEDHFSFAKDQGTGLGLSFARDVIRAHQGVLHHYQQSQRTVFEIAIAHPSPTQTKD